MKNFILTICCFVFLLPFSLKAQTPGTLDETFNGTGTVFMDNGYTDLFTAVKVQPDGKIVAAGISYDATWNAIAVVYRFNPDGWLDLSFGLSGSFMYSLNNEANIFGCYIDDEGSILINGSTTDYSVYKILLIKLTPNGFPDENFGTGGVVAQKIGPDMNFYEDHSSSITVQTDGKILLAGRSYNTDFKYVPVVVRFNADGSLDSSFGVDGVAGIPVTEVDNEFSAIKIQSDGKIVASGHISNGMSWFSLLIARFDQDGILDPTFGTEGVVNMNLNNIDDEFFGMEISQDDEIVLSGFTTTADLNYHLLVMKFDSYGQPVADFGDNGKVILGTEPMNVGYAMNLQYDNKILVTGTSGLKNPNNNDLVLWRLNPDGSLDNTFGTDGKITYDFFGHPDEGLAMDLFENKIIVAGKSRNANDLLDFVVARFNNDTYVSLPEHENISSFSVMPNPVKQNGTLTLSCDLKQAENLVFKLMDVTGNIIMETILQDNSAGIVTNNITLPASIAPGIYYVTLKGSVASFKTQKILVF